MNSNSRLGRQIAEVVAALNALGAPFALIGGLALVPYRVIRATRDVDFLTEAAGADAIDRELVELGYVCAYRSADAGNYVRGDERVDFLYAHRPVSRQLLATAVMLNTAFGELRVVSAEGLIGFKVQALVNDPRRTQDLEDIRALIRANRTTLDMAQVSYFFRLFERETLLEELLSAID
ncbi:MAG: hypothetical protein KGL92_06380 [Gammaproteobacteria bacterium]|nr:hypothetical protein [Gammaproteobacteria bacterium]